MSTPKKKLDRLIDLLIPAGVPFFDLKKERLWVLMILAGAMFSALFVILDFIIIVGPASLLCASVTLASPLYLWLFKSSYRGASKILMHLHVLAILFVITLLYTEQGYAWTFLIPVLMSSVLIFTQQQRLYSIVVICTAFAFVPGYLAVSHLFQPLEFDETSMNTFKIMNLSGSMTFCLIILLKITRMNERVQNQLKLQIEENVKQNKIMLGSMRTRDKLLSMMSHDVRGDIGKTIGVVDVIEQMNLTKEDQATLLHNLKIDAVKTLETLDNMLQWTRTQQDELNAHMTPYEVDRLVSSLLNNHEYSIQSKRLKIRLYIPSDLTLSADHNMIDSVFRNLLGNAIKFTPVGGIISISAKLIDSWVEFSIQDSGVGMTSEQLDNITKGVQFTTRGTNREKGRGFGMVLVKEFLSKHKSELIVESTSGKGTTFSFKLPHHKTENI